MCKMELANLTFWAHAAMMPGTCCDDAPKSSHGHAAALLALERLKGAAPLLLHHLMGHITALPEKGPQGAACYSWITPWGMLLPTIMPQGAARNCWNASGAPCYSAH
ncbi:hypothetical protein DUNSADRAFT_8597 [Dunaliella salina]|uniref:Encoded protein n=1 Tax=Dunaliella salina TaxID=3046 RepID=A0ABQ7H5Q9_DUNSA|nr:hypothetical protein DUNSADRAFT_8597 [Dunaliella salina]KAF5842198.1 hypothetical protein DUNSADRAFT_8597 [Dunaliella salina]|eukprot:KAF5842197.1 hypothetical protein DUNSADRAFT_8597 [Dunaliella salina]